jgi:hypothetical protein
LVNVTGEDAETAAARAVQERLSRIAPAAAAPDRSVALRAFMERVASPRMRDERQPDALVGYGPEGLLG